MLGYQVDEILNQHLFNFLDAQSVEVAKVNLARRRQGYEEQREAKFQHKEGFAVYTMLVTWPVFDEKGQYKGAIAGVVDDAQRQTMLHELTEIKEKLQLFDKVTLDGIIIHQGGRIIELNDASCRMLEGCRTELMQRDFTAMCVPESKQLVIQAMQSESINKFEVKIQTTTGKVLNIEWTCRRMNYRGDSVRVSVLRNVTQYRQAQTALEQIELTNQALIENAPEAIVLFDPASGKILQANTKSQAIFGLTGQSIFDYSIQDLLAEQDGKLVGYGHEFESLLELANSCLAPMAEVKIKHASGALIDCELRLVAIQWQGRSLLRASLLDIRARKQAQSKMRQLSSALEQSADMVLITNRQGTIEYVNQATTLITGYNQAELIGQQPDIFNSGQHDKTFIKNLWSTILKGKAYRDVLVNRKKNGDIYYEEKTITPLKNDQGEITHFVSTGKDITERMEIQANLRHLAFHDVLTDLPNRALFNDRLKTGLLNTKRRRQQMALLFFDIDHFKRINDTLGHDIGDVLLQQVAKKLKKGLRGSDTVARLGGDEFAVILNDCQDENAIRHTAEKIIELINKPVKLADRELFVTTSIGIAVYPQDGTDSQALLKNADVAMYRAKSSGRNTYMFYRQEMNAHAFERLTLESELHRAIQQQEFVLYYQPKVCLQTGLILGVEALLRWRHPELGILLPEKFIPLLEDTGLIVPVGQWVIEQALADCNQWYEQGLEHIKMAVNLSPNQLKDVKFIEGLQNALAQHQLSTSCLELEITENTMMADGEKAFVLMQQLQQIGIKFSVDDFGTGYSSLAYLKRLPVETIKIDRSFIQDIGIEQEDEIIVKTVIAMAKSLGYRVVAEGVENLEQVNFLKSLNCDIAQGFLFSRPIPSAELVSHLQDLQHQASNLCH
ncbi:PAS/PAC sensors-containing diguanylate cyclase/phosphodiesterase [Catenovulum agarivorans DS-2]|uniref:cyclic-guanylate-specific phosphodiesterase n=2 Tax=Catenovulum agarivorans TaxID=1172192 RepID=W7QEH6_9ALTE|nr:PAS/PAC sensors-containing diguanylate cyclase/phosphodiesterase [Catenovulum agarivorans DS-2]